jgi:DNA-directed RNA polymerase subunit RPC12/RpoP
MATFECRQCGAELDYSPSDEALACPYCGAKQAVPAAAGEVKELDYRAQLEAAAEAAQTEERLTARCTACGAETTFEANVTSAECAFCGTNIVLTQRSSKLIKPQAVLPFAIDRDRARTSFRRWIGSRWFAPSGLKKLASSVGGIIGTYIPSWTFDCTTTSRYRGERGDDYTTTESYTTTEGGRTVHKTREVRKTHWTPAQGTVRNAFDDVLVLATESLPKTYADRLEPWDLDQLLPYSDEYLSGFRAESYSVDLAEGFERARKPIDEGVLASIHRDIGGDHQRVHSVDTAYSGITFKHILLPVWLSAYRFKGEVFRFLVNARTGEVQGERPHSWIKITLAILAGLAAVGALLWLMSA